MLSIEKTLLTTDTTTMMRTLGAVMVPPNVPIAFALVLLALALFVLVRITTLARIRQLISEEFISDVRQALDGGPFRRELQDIDVYMYMVTFWVREYFLVIPDDEDEVDILDFYHAPMDADVYGPAPSNDDVRVADQDLPVVPIVEDIIMPNDDAVPIVEDIIMPNDDVVENVRAPDAGLTVVANAPLVDDDAKGSIVEGGIRRSARLKNKKTEPLKTNKKKTKKKKELVGVRRSARLSGLDAVINVVETGSLVVDGRRRSARLLRT